MHAALRCSFGLLWIVGALFPLSGLEGADTPADRPLQVIQTVEFNFGRPSLDLAVPASGEVRVLALIDQTGELRDLLVLGSSHPSFIAPVATGLKEWDFVPATKNGEATGARAILRIFVEPHRGAAVVSVMEAVADKLRGRREVGFESYVISANELDSPLRTIQQVSPVVPLEWASQERDLARVVVDFYIDQTGRPRMPLIERSPDPLLAVAVLDALAHWQFETPFHARQPVIVRVRQEFTFLAQSPGRVGLEKAGGTVGP